MRVFFISAAAALALSAMPASAQTPAADPRLTPAPGIRVDGDFLVGRWSDREDCGAQIDFRADGQFFNPDGSHGTWRIVGDTLTLSGTRTLTVRLVPRNRDELTVINPDNTLGYSRRCDGQPDGQKRL